ncbi:DUF1361 domain-containing protein [Rhodococcus sp. NPDC058514]|uniref:DUF1361 domain-containing protein n=1 Tax=unclassified Rhodococcus (in: high G+C Gram-positive bacteria) TaxID=192944 RepID=UPI00366414FE
MSFSLQVQLAVALNIYALVMILARSWIYRVPVYRPMLKNFVLSVLPLILLVAAVALAALASGLVSPILGVAVGVVGFLAWLLALPNSGYLITELNLNHRRENESVPLWYDIISVLTFAMSGVINTVLGILAAQFAFVLAVYGDDNEAVEALPVRAVGVIVIVLVTVGIYLGRYLRLNSWDVRSPTRMWTKFREHFDGWPQIGNFALFCLTHTLFLLIVYGIVAGPVFEEILHATTGDGS